MRQVALGTGLRILLGVLGGAAVVAGIVVGAAEGYRALHGWPWPAVLAVLFCVVVICGGLLLIQGARTGRIVVRDPSRRASRERRQR